MTFPTSLKIHFFISLTSKKPQNLKGSRYMLCYLCSYLILAWSPLPPVRKEFFSCRSNTEEKQYSTPKICFAILKAFHKKGRQSFTCILKRYLLSSFCTFTLSRHSLLLSAFQLILYLFYNTVLSLLTVHAHRHSVVIFYTFCEVWIRF